MSYNVPPNVLEDFLKTVPYDKGPIKGLMEEDSALQTYAYKLTKYGEYTVNYRNEPWGTHKEFFEVLDGNGYVVRIHKISTYYEIAIEREAEKDV